MFYFIFKKRIKNVASVLLTAVTNLQTSCVLTQMLLTQIVKKKYCVILLFNKDYY